MNKTHAGHGHGHHEAGNGGSSAAIKESGIDIGIDERERLAAVEALRRLAADEFVLYAKTRNYHWNVTGPQFGELHRFFEESYRELDAAVDEISERVRALGCTASGSLAEFLHDARLKESCGELAAPETMLRSLREDHESLVRVLRREFRACAGRGDEGTAEFLSGLLARHEKKAWVLRSLLGEEGTA